MRTGVGHYTWWNARRGQAANGMPTRIEDAPPRQNDVRTGGMRVTRVVHPTTRVAVNVLQGKSR